MGVSSAETLLALASTHLAVPPDCAEVCRHNADQTHFAAVMHRNQPALCAWRAALHHGALATGVSNERTKFA